MTNGAMKKLYKLYAFVVYLIPMLILFFARINNYVNPEQAIGFFGIVLIIFVSLYFSRQILDKGFQGKTPIIISGILFIFSFITQYIANELMIITGVSFVAALLSEFINQVSYVYENYEYKIIDGVKRKNLDKALPQKDAWREAYGIFGS